MKHCIIVGCDQHKKSLSICAAMNKEEPTVWRVQNNSQGRQELIKRLKDMAAPMHADIELTYEASYLGLWLMRRAARCRHHMPRLGRDQDSYIPSPTPQARPTPRMHCDSSNCCADMYWPATSSLTSGCQTRLCAMIVRSHALDWM